MKVSLRIFVILLSLGIVVTALLPPPHEAAEAAAPAPVPTVQASESQKVIRDLLGGSAIDQGKKAQENISELNQLREQQFEENGL
jgi:hypothetical protein